MLVDMLQQLDDGALLEPSALPEWSRLTVVCHLRYGATALLRITRDTLAGKPTAYYPGGRATQRPSTLEPAPGEHAPEVVSSLASVAAELDTLWSSLGDDDWRNEVRESPDNPDLGTIPLARLALSRLTEVDVHGTDLAIGFPDWSDVLVEVALPTRLGWLSQRRTNHRRFDRFIQGSWLLSAPDGPAWLVTVDGESVEATATDPATAHASATIEGSRRDLLALLLGRSPSGTLRISGNVDFATSFSEAFPGP
jgi:uncharacterized protein (TIGR03083 family)